VTGPTGTNVMDLMLVLIGSDALLGSDALIGSDVNGGGGSTTHPS